MPAFPLLLKKGESIDLTIEDIPMTLQAQYRHVFPDIHALMKYAQDAADLRYDGLTVTHPPDYATSIAGAQKFFSDQRRAQLDRRLQRARVRSVKHARFIELRDAFAELFRIVQRERLLPQAREEQIAQLIARWRE